VTPLFATSLLPALVGGRERRGSGAVDRLAWRQPRTFSMLEPWYAIVDGYFFTRLDRGSENERFGRTLAERRERTAEHRAWLEHWRRVHRPRYLRRLRRLQRFDPARATGAAVLAHLAELEEDAAEWWYLF